MNKELGGQNPTTLQNGYFISNDHTEAIIQFMNLSSTHSDFPGQPKGLNIVLGERQLRRNREKTGGD